MTDEAEGVLSAESRIVFGGQSKGLAGTVKEGDCLNLHILRKNNRTYQYFSYTCTTNCIAKTQVRRGARLFTAQKNTYYSCTVVQSSKNVSDVPRSLQS